MKYSQWLPASALALFVGGTAGFVAGRAIPQKPTPHMLLGGNPHVQEFHHCLAAIPNRPRPRSWENDDRTLRIAVEMLATQSDCLRLSSIRGYTTAQVQNYSGFRFPLPEYPLPLDYYLKKYHEK